ncbi:MAG: iron ABC transporter permease [Thermodesulfovibrionales bacterium]|nr:iron ABC transporter permease [Thermodesulfovibrionales bacterium]
MIFLRNFMGFLIVVQDNKSLKILLIIALFILSPVFSLFIGAYQLPPHKIWQVIDGAFRGQTTLFNEGTILFDIRIPRIIIAMLVGFSVSVSSATFQATFRNPLVSEYILGLSSGAAFGASLSIAFFGDHIPIQPLAFVFGIIAVFMSYLLSRIKGESTVLSLVLSGIITTAVFTAGNYIIRYIVEPEKLQGIVVWLMGSLSAASWNDIYWSAPWILIGSALLILLRWRLNVLSMGDEEAKALGVDVGRLKVVFILLATLITASAVSVVGIIGWIGLMVPHITRMLLGTDNRLVLPMSGIIGAILMLIADNIVRVSSGVELPVGVLTTLIGAPFFAYLIRKTKGGWE